MAAPPRRAGGAEVAEGKHAALSRGSPWKSFRSHLSSGMLVCIAHQPVLDARFLCIGEDGARSGSISSEVLPENSAEVSAGAVSVQRE